MANLVDLTGEPSTFSSELLRCSSSRDSHGSYDSVEVVEFDISSTDDDPEMSLNSRSTTTRKRFTLGTKSADQALEIDSSSSISSNKRPAVALTLDDEVSSFAEENSPPQLCQEAPKIIELDLSNSSKRKDEICHKANATSSSTHKQIAPTSGNCKLGWKQYVSRSNFQSNNRKSPSSVTTETNSKDESILSTLNSHVSLKSKGLRENIISHHVTSSFSETVHVKKGRLETKNTFSSQQHAPRRDWKDVAKRCAKARSNAVNQRENRVSTASPRDSLQRQAVGGRNPKSENIGSALEQLHRNKGIAASKKSEALKVKRAAAMFGRSSRLSRFLDAKSMKALVKDLPTGSSDERSRKLQSRLLGKATGPNPCVSISTPVPSAQKKQERRRKSQHAMRRTGTAFGASTKRVSTKASPLYEASTQLAGNGNTIDGGRTPILTPKAGSVTKRTTVQWQAQANSTRSPNNFRRVREAPTAKLNKKKEVAPSRVGCPEGTTQDIASQLAASSGAAASVASNSARTATTQSPSAFSVEIPCISITDDDSSSDEKKSSSTETSPTVVGNERPKVHDVPIPIGQRSPFKPKKCPFSPMKGKRLRPRQPARSRARPIKKAKTSLDSSNNASKPETRFVMHIDLDEDSDSKGAKKPHRASPTSDSSGYSTDSFHIEAMKNDGYFVRRGPEGRLLWKCRMGHTFSRHFKGVLDGKWCGQCSRLREMEWRQRAAELNRRMEEEWQQNAQHEQDFLFKNAKIRMARKIEEERRRQERIRQMDSAYQNGQPNPSSKDPYMCLGLPKDSSDRDIKKRYRSLALKYHPDKNTAPEANRLFCAFTVAYELLVQKSK